MARVVARNWSFDFDHVGTQIGQHLGAPRPGQHAGKVQHFEVSQGALRGRTGGSRRGGRGSVLGHQGWILVGKCRNAGLRAAQNERVNVMRAFVGVNHFEIDQMARHTELIADAVTPHHVTCHSGNIERFAA